MQEVDAAVDLEEEGEEEEGEEEEEEDGKVEKQITKCHTQHAYHLYYKALTVLFREKMPTKPPPENGHGKSHITHHTSHITQHTSHSTKHTAHITQHTAHSTRPTHRL